MGTAPERNGYNKKKLSEDKQTSIKQVCVNERLI